MSPQPAALATPIPVPGALLLGQVPWPLEQIILRSADGRLCSARLESDGTFRAIVPPDTTVTSLLLTDAATKQIAVLDLTPEDLALLRQGRFRVPDAAMPGPDPATAAIAPLGASPTAAPPATQPMDGKAVFSSPDTMDLFETRTVELVVGQDVSPASLKAIIARHQKARADSSPIHPPVDLQLDEMRDLEATLVSTPAGAFVVTPKAESRQRLDSNRISQWSWEVAARRVGTHTLELHLTAHFADGTSRELENFPRRLSVRVTAIQVTVAVLALFAVAGAARTLRVRLREAAAWVQRLFKEGLHMSKIDIKGQQIAIAAVGDHARADNTRMAQAASPSGEELASIATDLETLRAEMRKRSSGADHDIATAEVAQAHDAAVAGDGSRTLSHLAKAGQWALDVATSIGKTVLVDLIKKAAGM